MRSLRTCLLLVLSLLLAATGCSRQSGGGLQADVAMHCAELQRNTEQAAKIYRAGLDDLPPIGGEISGHLLSRLYNEVNWCSRVRSEGQRELMGLMQELSIVVDTATSKLPLARQGVGGVEGGASPEASAARVEVSGYLNRIAVIIGEINQRPLKR
ncbi:hypothetical protein [Pyxidicoccus caerfyrddinensis]|uniref:hypothetical protein n=1 Tax=Pyxidicoccus caerfyrddinensis TaxID=2709663 RepID=UPI0013DCBBB2|nr:hypothetical protein [Pyxidicoccus caerfyrddinensis]